MAKSASIYARIEPGVKREAEGILEELGLSSSAAINIFYRQIIMEGGLPFEVKLKRKDLPDISEMSEKDLEKEIAKGMEDLKAGRVRDVDQVFSNLGD